MALYRLLGLDFPDHPESRRRMEKQADFYRQQTVPMIKPTGDRLAYYKPGYYTAQKDVFLAIGKKKVPAFAQGKKYYVYPIQHSEVIELPGSELLEAEDGDETKAKLTRRNMSLHCTYTALAMTSELKPGEIHGYSQQNGQAYKVITADEYELARQIQQAAAMGNPGKVDELKKRLKALYGRRIHITSKDPNLAEVLQASAARDQDSFGGLPRAVERAHRAVQPDPSPAHRHPDSACRPGLVETRRGLDPSRRLRQDPHRRLRGDRRRRPASGFHRQEQDPG